GLVAVRSCGSSGAPRDRKTDLAAKKSCGGLIAPECLPVQGASGVAGPSAGAAAGAWSVSVGVGRAAGPASGGVAVGGCRVVSAFSGLGGSDGQKRARSSAASRLSGGIDTRRRSSAGS